MDIYGKQGNTESVSQSVRQTGSSTLFWEYESIKSTHRDEKLNEKNMK